jgi:hypothetical protein
MVEIGNMPLENLNESSIPLVRQKVESSISETCSRFSCRSIVEKALTDLCFSHNNHLSSLATMSFLKENFGERMYRLFFQSSVLLTPHYLACFSTVFSHSDKHISDDEYHRLRNLVTSWLFLTEIPYSGLLYYFDRLTIDTETFIINQRFRVKDFFNSCARFKQFFSDYGMFEIGRPQAAATTIFQFALEDINGLDELIMSEIGTSPSEIIKTLYRLAFEWSNTFKYSEEILNSDGINRILNETCYLLMDYSPESIKTVLKPLTLDEAQQILSQVTLTAERASKYLESRISRKRNQEISMHSYPLWDYPLVKVEQNYLSHPILLTESFQELAYRFVCCSKNALARFVNKQHTRLMQKVCAKFRECGFSQIKTNLKVTKDGIEKAQFDIIAMNGRSTIHIECKTARAPWRVRMYFNPRELEKEGQDFLKQNKLSAEAWNEKLKWLGVYIKDHFGGSCGEPSNMVITDMPTPAQDICKHVNIMWVERLESYLRSEFKP